MDPDQTNPEDIHHAGTQGAGSIGPNQYSWHAIGSQWPDLENTYQALCAQLITRVERWIDQKNMNIKQFDVIGFSQGAVMAYALSFLFPERVNKVAALAGFVPISGNLP